jgi:RHS repeat-associated protein
MIVAGPGTNELKFTGKRRDTESQLDNFGSRYYSHVLGRFVTPDWAANAAAVPYARFNDPQSLNLYSYVRNVPTTLLDLDGHQDEKKSSVPGLKYQPSIGDAVEVSVGACVCAGGTAKAGPVNVNASAELVGVEASTTGTGDTDVKVNAGKVALGMKAGPVGGTIEAGTQFSAKDGLSAGGQGTINGVGIQADTKNGVTPVVQGSGDNEISGTAKLGVVKITATAKPSVIGQIIDAMKTNIPIVVGSVLDHFIPGAGTPSVGQTAPRSNVGPTPGSGDSKFLNAPTLP